MSNGARYFPQAIFEDGNKCRKREKLVANPPNCQKNQPLTGSFRGLLLVQHNCLQPVDEVEHLRNGPGAPRQIAPSPRVPSNPTPKNTHANRSVTGPPALSNSKPSSTETRVGWMQEGWQQARPKSKPKSKSKRKQDTCMQSAQKILPARPPEDPEPRRVARHPNAQPAPGLNRHANKNLMTNARPPPGRNRSSHCLPAPVNSASTRSVLSQGEEKLVRGLVLGLSKKVKDSWKIIFQLGGMRGRTVSMRDLEKAIGSLGMSIVNGDGAQFKCEPTKFGTILNANNIVYHRTLDLGHQKMVDVAKDFEKVYPEVYAIICEILG